jgi:hypothetical protein
MKSTRTRHSAALKAKVALAAIRSKKPSPSSPGATASTPTRSTNGSGSSWRRRPSCSSLSRRRQRQHKRSHQALGYQTPDAFFRGLINRARSSARQERPAPALQKRPAPRSWIRGWQQRPADNEGVGESTF